MPPVSVPALNDITVFQIIMQGKNVSEVKRILVETVTQMSARRWNRGFFPSTYRTTKRGAESDLLTVLNTSNFMNEIKQVLRNYQKQLNYVQHRTLPEDNTSAVMKGTGLLIGQPSSLENISKADDELMKLPVMEPEVYQHESGQYSDKNPLLSDISATPGAPADILASICIRIRKVMEKAGYHPDEVGICYGIAWTALLACVRRGGKAYMERMQYLNHMDVPPLPGDGDTHQVYPFFDAVILSMTSYRNMSGYEKGIGYPGRQEVAFPGRVIGSHEPGYQVPVVKHNVIAECTPEIFIQFLWQIRENNKGVPFGVMINYPNHATSIGFDGNKWLAADHDNHFYTETTDLLYTFLGGQNSYHKDDKMIAAMEVVAGNEHFLSINSNVLVANAKKSVSVSLVLHLALQYGYENVTTECITVIGQQAHIHGTLFERLICKDARGMPGLFMALQSGHTKAIVAFIQTSVTLIAALPLSEAQKSKLLCDLLACKRADDTPGFFMALYNARSDVITAFIQESAAAIARLSLSKTEKAKCLYELLACKSADGVPGFCIALYDGDTKAITAFIKASAAVINALSLPYGQKINLLCELLADKTDDGIPGFFMALNNGHSDAITAFIQESAAAIASLSLPMTEKVKCLYELLASRNTNGGSGFSAVLYNGHTEAITAFIKESTAVITALLLPERQKTKLLCELLTSKDDNGTPGFLLALQEGYPAAITAFIQESVAAIARLSLSDTEKAKWLYELLASRNTTSNTPGFFMALQEGHSAAITAFIQESAAAIGRLSLSDTEKAKWLYELLASRGTTSDTPGFFMTLQNGHPDAIIAFIQASTAVVIALPLQEKRKAELLYRLLVSKRADGAPGFYVALQKGNPDVITAFIQASTAAVSRLLLPKAEKARWLCELLASKRGNGVPGFFMTFRNGHSAAITAFIQESAAAMAILSETEEERAELLYRLFYNMKNDSKAIFCVILKQSCSMVKKAFIGGIDRLPLSPEQKETLKHPALDYVDSTVAVNQ